MDTKKCPVTCIDTENGEMTIFIDSPNKGPLTQHDLNKALQGIAGVQNPELARWLVENQACALPSTIGKAERYNIALQSMMDLEPRDSVEARLISQMTVLHAQAMRYLNLAQIQENTYHQEHYMRFAEKLFRIHNETTQAFCKYRSRGEQRITIQHVHVNNGGKAVVGGGDVMAGGGGQQ